MPVRESSANERRDAVEYLQAASGRGEKCFVYTFDESTRTARIRAASLGLKIEEQIAGGQLVLKQIDAAELSPGEFVAQIRHAVDEEHARLIVIDSLNGFLHSMTGEADLPLQLHELLTFLGSRGVATLLVLTQHDFVGDTRASADVSYLADNVLLMRYFEAHGKVRRAFSVIKKRSGSHETAIRELTLSSNGVQIGEPLSQYRGILSGSAMSESAPADTILESEGTQKEPS